MAGENWSHVEDSSNQDWAWHTRAACNLTCQVLQGGNTGLLRFGVPLSAGDEAGNEAGCECADGRVVVGQPLGCDVAPGEWIPSVCHVKEVCCELDSQRSNLQDNTGSVVVLGSSDEQQPLLQC